MSVNVEALIECEVGAGYDSLELLQAIYRDQTASRSVRMRAAIAALPYERPRLQVTAHVSQEDLAARLEAMRRRCVAQPVIEATSAEAKAVTPVDAPFARLRRM